MSRGIVGHFVSRRPGSSPAAASPLSILWGQLLGVMPSQSRSKLHRSLEIPEILDLIFRLATQRETCGQAYAGRSGKLSSFSVELDGIVDSEAHWAGKIPAICDALCDSGFSSSLARLDITPLVLSGSIFTALQQLPSLTTLRISIFGFQQHELASLGQPLHFPSLNVLSVDTTSLPTCSTFFQCICAPGLEVLTLGCMLTTNTNPAPFFLALQDCQNYANLKRIILREIYNGDDDEPEWQNAASIGFIFDESTARPLRCFKKLTKLSIEPCITLQLSDVGLQEMLAAWPCLEDFCLNDDCLRAEYRPPSITLAGVHQALQSVPLLEGLTLSFDGSVLPSSELPQLHQALGYWDVGSSSITLSNRASAWFIEHYPALSELDYFTAYQEALNTTYCWGDIDEDERTQLDRLQDSVMMVDRWSTVSKRIRARGNTDGE
ncbi:hypothetical protein BKA70DRAFT_1579401 [Coprinopsis sp. MPI-PUGE-AT-0042]|nr:hypothetical protein BKA70DRAFT_1579401 [Coprinopsis sp. MPI-PUGE-AT-0042]